MLLRRYKRNTEKAVKKTAETVSEDVEVKNDGEDYTAVETGEENATEQAIAEEELRKQYTKSGISRMSTADLKALAPTLGIMVTEESTGAKLKEEIIAKLGL